MKAAKTNYDYMKTFAAEYKRLEISLVMYWGQAVAIMKSHSTCVDDAGNHSCHSTFESGQ